MGQMLGFAHCKDAPSTASSTPDSKPDATDAGGKDESDFPELHMAQEFSGDEEEILQEWGTSQEPTFSYITFAASGADGNSINLLTNLVELGAQPWWDSSARQQCQANRITFHKKDKRSLGLARTDTQETFLLDITDSLESISSLSQSLGDNLPVITMSKTCHLPNPSCGTKFRDGPLALPEDKAFAQPIVGERETEPVLDVTPSFISGSWNDHCKVISGVADLVYWRNTQTSAIVCTSLVVSLLCLSQFSIISVGSYMALLLLCATITLRVYKKALQVIHKSDGVNPFQVYFEEDVSLSKEQVDKYVERALAHLTSAMKTLRHLFLVEDLVDSLKLLVLLYLFTYIGKVFNGLTMLILGVISAFSLPLLYRQHQAQIDQYVGLVRNHRSQIRAKIEAKFQSTKPKDE